MDVVEKELVEARANICWWFSTLFAHELSEVQLSSYLKGDGAKYLKQLESIELFEDHISTLRSALEALNTHKIPHLELAAQFTELFLTDAKAGAPPYASVYLSKSGLMFQEQHQAMVKLLADKGIVVDKNFNEPADHIAIQLDYLGNLILRGLSSGASNSIEAEKEAFINAHLLNWLPLLIKKVKSKRTASPFYTALLVMLVDYLEEEVKR
ncbi:molecular chaperone TorD [Thalassotalea euphylliae]|uniref:molecular chaperone TorD n=1 Tax=Thalassotalea euphylliae TaxID=1655234 RepID=UPI00363B48F9